MPRARKALKLIVEIDVHAVTCPGVWLSADGDILLHVCFLGFHTRTKSLHPRFPLLFHEKLLFEKTFLGCSLFHHLETTLTDQIIYLELLQISGRNSTIVLATFETSALEFLYPYHNFHYENERIHVDLLTEPTRDFPGILYPKIEVSIKTTLTETRNPIKDLSQDFASNLTSGNQHMQFSKSRALTSPADPKPLEKSRARSFTPQKFSPKKDKRPPFVVRHVDSKLFSHFHPLPKRHPGKHKGFLSQSTGHLDTSTYKKQLKQSPRRFSAPTISQRHYVPRNSSYNLGIHAENNQDGNIPRSSSMLDFNGLNKHSSMQRKNTQDERALVADKCPPCYSGSEHKRYSCTVCKLYKDYFGEDYTGHSPYFHAPHNKHKSLMVLSQDGDDRHQSRKFYSWGHDNTEDISPLRPHSVPLVSHGRHPLTSSPYSNRNNQTRLASVVHENVQRVLHNVRHNPYHSKEDGYDSHDEHLYCNSHEGYLDFKYPKRMYSNTHSYPMVHLDGGHYWSNYSSLYTGKSHRLLFYENMEKFYHKMYQRAKAKALLESSRV